MTNYEMIKQFSLENLALTIMCPYEAGLIDKRRCNDETCETRCVRCCLKWLQEESL